MNKNRQVLLSSSSKLIVRFLNGFKFTTRAITILFRPELRTDFHAVAFLARTPTSFSQIHKISDLQPTNLAITYMSFLASLNSVDKNPDLILENVGSIVSTSKLEQTSNHQGKISLVLQDTPPGTPGVSKNSQKYFTNKNVEFFLVNFIQNENNIKKHQMFFGFSKLLEVWSNFRAQNSQIQVQLIILLLQTTLGHVPRTS